MSVSFFFFFFFFFLILQCKRMQLTNCFQNHNAQLVKRHAEYWFQLSVPRLPRDTPFYSYTWRKTSISAIPLDVVFKFKRNFCVNAFSVAIWFWFCCLLITSNGWMQNVLIWECIVIKADFLLTTGVPKTILSVWICCRHVRRGGGGGVADAKRNVRFTFMSLCSKRMQLCHRVTGIL